MQQRQREHLAVQQRDEASLPGTQANLRARRRADRTTAFVDGSGSGPVAAGGYRPMSADPMLDPLAIMAPSSPVWAEGVEDLSDEPAYGSREALLARRKAERMPAQLASNDTAAGYRQLHADGGGTHAPSGIGYRQMEAAVPPTSSSGFSSSLSSRSSEEDCSSSPLCSSSPWKGEGGSI